MSSAVMIVVTSVIIFVVASIAEIGVASVVDIVVVATFLHHRYPKSIRNTMFHVRRKFCGPHFTKVEFVTDSVSRIP